MKKATFFLLAALPFASVALAESYTLQVNGLKCQYCADKLERELQTLEGFESVSFDLDAKHVELNLADAQELQEDRLRQTIQDAGFNLVKVIEPAKESSGHAGR
jgi:copper chaperone CopZ